MNTQVKRPSLIGGVILGLGLCQGAAASPLDCDSAAGDDRYTAEQCTSQELAQAIAATANTSEALTRQLSTENAQHLKDLAQSREAYHRQYCHLIVTLTAEGNDAWALTWKDIALDACHANMLTQHQTQLNALLDIANRKNSQQAGFAAPASEGAE